MKLIRTVMRFLADVAIVIAPTLIRDVSGLTGAGLIAYGSWRVYEPAGFIVAGVLLLIGTILVSRNAG